MKEREKQQLHDHQQSRPSVSPRSLPARQSATATTQSRPPSTATAAPATLAPAGRPCLPPQWIPEDLLPLPVKPVAEHTAYVDLLYDRAR